MSGILQVNCSVFIKDANGNFVKLTDKSQIPDDVTFDLRHQVSEDRVWEFHHCRATDISDDGEIIEVTFEEMVVDGSSQKESINGQTTE